MPNQRIRILESSATTNCCFDRQQIGFEENIKKFLVMDLWKGFSCNQAPKTPVFLEVPQRDGLAPGYQFVLRT